jgi:hypothetical protein
MSDLRFVIEFLKSPLGLIFVGFIIFAIAFNLGVAVRGWVF